MKRALLAVLAVAGALPLAAQDPIDRVRIGINYTGGTRPGIVVVAAPGLDSVRKVIERDLDFSDRYEVAILADSVGIIRGAFNAAVFTQLGIQWAVELRPITGGVEAKLHDLQAGQVRQRWVRGLDVAASGPMRMEIHRLSDGIVGMTGGGIGIAASRIAFTLDGAIWAVDSDGENLRQLTRGGGQGDLSAEWSPDGQRIAFTELRGYAGAITLQNVATGARQTVPGTGAAGTLNSTPAWSPDGRMMTFARSSEDGTDLYSVNLAQMCCVQRLTTSGKLAINQYPTYSPDGRRVAFVSSRAGQPQIYAMDADGSGPELLVPYEVGGTGSSFSADWSPDGGRLAFHRDVGGGGRQVHVYEFGSGRTRTLTSTGRNEDPSWGPDSRHLVFSSSRGGRQQLWVLDLDSGRLRQLTSVSGRARLAAWSPSLQR